MDAEDGKACSTQVDFARETVLEEDNVRLETNTPAALLLHQAHYTQEFVDTPAKGQSETIEFARLFWYWRINEVLGRSRRELCPVLVGGSSSHNDCLHEGTPIPVAR